MGTDDATAADRNLLTALGVWASAAEDGQLDHVDGCTFVRCAASLRAFNQVLVTRRPDDVAAIVARTSEYFREVGGRFRLRVRDDTEPIQDEPFLNGGLLRKDGIPSLCAPVSSAGGATTIEVRAVMDELALAHHIDVVALAFDWWREELARVFRRSLLDSSGWHAYVGYLDGQPVSTTQLIVDGDVGGLYYVGTTEHARGRGLGESMTRHAITAAASLGCTRVTLQASPMGLPIYERIGFKHVSYYRTFVGK